jgi:predicted transcriptional regulator
MDRSRKKKAMSETAEALITLTADIVAAHVSNNAVAVSDLGPLIANVHGALTALGTATAASVPEVKAEPAVSVRSSVKPDAIACLCCGKRMLMLKRHLSTDHGLTVEGYRQMWNLPKNYPMVAPDYALRRRTLAISIGLGRKPKGKK